MTRLATFKVDGLFGHATHNLNLRLDAPTIITAPNGAGKTHVLQLINASLGLEAATLLRLPFRTCDLGFADGRHLVVQRNIKENGEAALAFSVHARGRQTGLTRDVTAAELQDDDKRLPSYIQDMGDGRWFDAAAGRMLPPATMERRYGIHSPLSPEGLFRGYEHVLDVVRGTDSIMIDTKRLDARELPTRGVTNEAALRRAPRATDAGSIGRYIDRIRAEVVDARRNSVQATQSSDVSFAARALAAAGATVNEKDLRERYDGVVKEYERLARNGLAVGETPLKFPAKNSPTVRRILNVFLDDWKERLKPLLPVNAKVETLRNILDTKLAQSGKRTEMDVRGQLTFHSLDGRRIQVARLSSGEQHLVALFTQLLFSAKQGSVVLIDEPEISMHAAWKHAFLSDISMVARVADLQVILATHSTAIVNGRWELEEPLELALPIVGEEGDGDSAIDEADLDVDDLS